MCLFGFLFLDELGTYPQNLMPTQGVEPWENHQFPEGGMLKFTYKGRFLTIKIAYENFLDWKSKWLKHALVPLQSFVIGQILAILGSFRQIWAEFAALIVVESMPKVRPKSSTPIICKPWIQMLYGASHWKATIHIYSLKSFKNSTNILYLQHLAQKCEKPFWLSSSFRG
jgi:hypothetical protein